MENLSVIAKTILQVVGLAGFMATTWLIQIILIGLGI